MRCAVVKEASWAEPPKARVACCHPTIRMLLWLHHGNEAWVLAGVLLKPGWWLFAQHAHRARENGVVRCREMSRGVSRCSSRQILARVSKIRRKTYVRRLSTVSPLFSGQLCTLSRDTLPHVATEKRTRLYAATEVICKPGDLLCSDLQKLTAYSHNTFSSCVRSRACLFIPSPASPP